MNGVFKIPHLRICLLILEGEAGGERERERDISAREKNIDRLLPVSPLMGDQT